MNPEEAKIKARLEEVLQSIFCPVGGCWPIHGCHCEFYCNYDAETHVLEVWPVGFQEAENGGGNGRERDEDGICHEFAEFEFAEMVKEIPLEHLHFSQRRQIFEIGWKEGSQDVTVLKVRANRSNEQQDIDTGLQTANCEGHTEWGDSPHQGGPQACTFRSESTTEV